MPKSTSRWRQFHTDELRSIFDALDIAQTDCDKPLWHLEQAEALQRQVRSELSHRGVPLDEMSIALRPVSA